MILSYEPDEQCIALVCVILALVMWGWAILLPFTLPVLYTKTKKKYPRGFFQAPGIHGGDRALQEIPHVS